LASASFSVDEHAGCTSIRASLSRLRHFYLRDQLIRAAISISANIAEGCGRTGDRELRRFGRVALGSASELEYHLLLANGLGALRKIDYDRLTAGTIEVKRMMTGLAARLTLAIEKTDS
jgi:four helix bundle protein